MRPDWDELFMLVAILVATRSSCLKRKVGCCVTIGRHTVSTGYNGAPSDMVTCLAREICFYEYKITEEHGLGDNVSPDVKERYKVFCVAVHAEENAVAQAAKLGMALDHGVLYVTNLPCPRCAKLVAQSGIREVKIWKPYLRNPALTFDEQKASEDIFRYKNIAVRQVFLNQRRLREMLSQVDAIGERTSYVYDPHEFLARFDVKNTEKEEKNGKQNL